MDYNIFNTLFLILIESVRPSEGAYCYYRYSYTYFRYNYYCSYDYWAVGSIVGAVIGGIIGLVVLVVIIVIICGVCNKRGGRGAVIQPTTTVHTVHHNPVTQPQYNSTPQYNQYNQYPPMGGGQYPPPQQSNMAYPPPPPAFAGSSQGPSNFSQPPPYPGAVQPNNDSLPQKS